MSGFVDQMLIRFVDEAFTTDFLENQIGLAAIFEASYTLEDFDLNALTLVAVTRREYKAPAFETVRISGSEEQLTPVTERWQIEGSMKRFGRLSWVDVALDILLGTTLQNNRMPIDSVTTRQLLDVIEGAATLAELRAKLVSRYSESIVSELFRRLRIATLDDFNERLNLIITFLFREPEPFDDDDPANSHLFPASVRIRFQPEFNISDSLQSAKLSRSILDSERVQAPVPDGINVNAKHVVVSVFPDSAVVDNGIPGMTAAQIRTSVRELFAAEGMIAHFFA